MTWTAPRTWVAGETVTAALLNTHVRDNLLALGTESDVLMSFVPGGNLDTPGAGTATWVTLGNVTVPTWATKCSVTWSVSAFVMPTPAALNVTAAIKVGSVAGPSTRLPGSNTATETAITYSDLLSGISTGSQSVTVSATFVAGTQVFRLDTADRITAAFRFLP